MKLVRLSSTLVALLAFAFCAGEADATLLFSGGEDIDFTCINNSGCGVQAGGSPFRTNWAREAYGVSGSSVDPPTNRFSTPTFSPNTSLWVHAQFCNNNLGCVANNTLSNYQMLRVLDPLGNPTLIIRGTGTAGQLKISSRTSAGAFTDLVTCSSAYNSTLTQVDFYINYGTSGEVSFYNNGVQVCDFQGNVTNGDGATTLNQIEFAEPNNQTSAWSEVIIATTDTRSMSRYSANTNGNGNTTGFSGTNVCSAIWNAGSYNDANYGYSGTSNIVHECTVGNSIPPGSYSVVGFVMSARALVGTSGPQHFDFVTRISGTDYTSPDFAPITSFTNFSNYIQLTNPSTGNPWAVSDFQASGFNVGEETKP
jgi:hypothetical protein